MLTVLHRFTYNWLFIYKYWTILHFFGYIFYKIQSKPNKKADEANKARNAVFLIITGG